jgi:hypothetical protein
MAVVSLPNEIWKDIPDYESLYQVSNFGRVKALYKKRILNNAVHERPERLIILGTSTGGHLVFNLCKDGIHKKGVVHRLVAKLFCLIQIIILKLIISFLIKQIIKLAIWNGVQGNGICAMPKKMG